MQEIGSNQVKNLVFVDLEMITGDWDALADTIDDKATAALHYFEFVLFIWLLDFTNIYEVLLCWLANKFSNNNFNLTFLCDF